MPHAGGRPSDYREEYAEQARKLALLSATDVDVAQFFNIGISTLYRWRHEHPEFREALKLGKEAADATVQDRLYKRATGYSHDAQKIMQHEGKPVVVDYVEHHPPDVTACIFWLKNRQPDLWRDRQEHTGAGGGPMVVVTGVARPDDKPDGGR